MTVFLWPDEGMRYAELPNGLPAGGRTALVALDSAGASLATIRTWDGSSVPGAVIVGSRVVLDAYGQLPNWWGPDVPVGTAPVLYVSVNSGPWIPVAPQANPRMTALENGGGGVLPAAMTVNRTGVTIVGHRGGGSAQGNFYQGPYPEETIEGFTAAIGAGVKWLNPHACLLADGAVALMHDSTPDRTTNATGAIDVSNWITPGWRKLLVTPQNVSLWSGYGEDWGQMHPPLLADLLDRVGGKAPLAIESVRRGAQTNGQCCSKIVALLQARGLTNTVIIQSFATTELTPAAAVGIETMYLTPDLPNAGSDAASIQAAMTAATGWATGKPKHVGINAFPTGQTQAQVVAYVTTLVAAGFTVWAYTVVRRYDYAWLVAAGVVGVIADEPVYLGTAVKVDAGTVDPFSYGVWPHGVLPSDQGRGRGNLVNSGMQLDFVNSSAQTQYVCYGTFSPPVSLTAYTIQADFVWDTLDADATRHADMMVCCPDDRATTATIGVGNGVVDGYQVIFRQSAAQMIVSKCNQSGQTINGLLTQTTGLPPAPIAGTVTTVKIQVTATQVIVTLIQAAVTYGPFAVTDSTYRGGYFHLGKAWNSGVPHLVGTWKNVSCA